jgi:hypothetical protein
VSAPNSLPIRFAIPIPAAHTAKPPAIRETGGFAFLPQAIACEGASSGRIGTVVPADKGGRPGRPLQHTPGRTRPGTFHQLQSATVNKQNAGSWC